MSLNIIFENTKSLDFSSLDVTTLEINSLGNQNVIDLNLIKYPPSLTNLKISADSLIPGPIPDGITELSLNAREDYKENFVHAYKLCLPNSICKLVLKGFHLTSGDYLLPSNLTELTFMGTMFAHITLPPNLKTLNIYGNAYGGKAFVGKLPDTLEHLQIRVYKGSFIIYYEDYPQTMKTIHLCGSKFTAPSLFFTEYKPYTNLESVIFDDLYHHQFPKLSCKVYIDDERLTTWKRNI